MKHELRSARRDRGWNLTQAAEHFGISVSYLCHIEKGTRTPRPELGLRLLNGYGIKKTVSQFWPDEERTAA